MEGRTAKTRPRTPRAPVRIYWFPRNPRVRSKSAAAQAVALADRIARNEVKPREINETVAFAALHTCGYRASRQPRLSRVTGVERARWRRRRATIRDYIVESNRGLVYAAVARIRPAYSDLDDLRGEGLLALVRAVDWFDPWRGVRFSTYAYNAIIRALIRLRRKASQYQQRFAVTLDFPVEMTEMSDANADLYLDRLHRAMESNLAELTEREADVLDHRFPRGDGRRLTLDEIGANFGLSKERVRQIQNRALAKLRNVLDVDPILQ
jgi:RNA polymerase sporulation-specific sigma factor